MREKRDVGLQTAREKKELANNIGSPPFLIVSKWHDSYFSSIGYVIMAR